MTMGIFMLILTIIDLICVGMCIAKESVGGTLFALFTAMVTGFAAYMNLVY